MALRALDGFNFFEMHLPKKLGIWRLVEKAGPEELMAELEKRDLYCKKCLGLINRCFANDTPVPEFRSFPTFF
jgi:hypothetical protein